MNFPTITILSSLLSYHGTLLGPLVKRRMVTGLVLSLVSIMLLACNDNTTNRAGAFGWHGFADTDLQFSEFFGSDFTIMTRFVLQYPNAYTGPILTVNGSGSFLIAQADVGSVSGGLPSLLVDFAGHQVISTLPSAGLGWHHVAVVRSGTAFKLYIDGGPVCTGADIAPCGFSIGTDLPAGTLRLGRLASGRTIPPINGRDAQFYGFIDDVAIFKTALSTENINQLSDTQNHPRLTGNENGLYAGWTFDEATPSGGPLPSTFGRALTFGSLTSGRSPAFAAIVSQNRNSSEDGRRLPLPFQQTPLQLPFPPDQAWEVLQGNNSTAGNSHRGFAAFALDFKLAGRPQSETKGLPFFSAAPGQVIEIADGKICSESPSNNIMVRQADKEIAGYLHFQSGSSKVTASPATIVSVGTELAAAGDSGTGCGAFHLHFAVTDLPESQNPQLVTFPVSFGNYCVSSDEGKTWFYVDPQVPDIPQLGQWVKKPSQGRSCQSPPADTGCPSGQRCCETNPTGGPCLKCIPAPMECP